MKLVPKLALALFAGVFVVVAAYTAFRVRSEIELFDQDVRRVQRIVGSTAGAALSKTRTREEAIRLARRVEASRGSIRVRFVSLDRNAAPPLRPLVPLDLTPAPGEWKQVVKPRAPSNESADLLVTYVGAPVVDEALGAIELAQPLASRAEYIWRGIWSGLASSLAMLTVGGLTVVLIGARVVGRPVSQLIHATRKIGEGDFKVLETIRRRDEFGELADALRSMSRELEAERFRTREEAEARIQALEQLRHADRLTTLGQLASVLAHEIGTPLNVIAGHGKLIAGGRMAADGIAESAAAIGEQSERITRIVRRILDYARRRPARRARLDASDVVRQACALLQGLAVQRRVILDVIEPGNSTLLDADPDQLQQAVTNLVLNAIHATPAHEHVRVTSKNVERADRDNDERFVAISVHDAGPGISDDIRDRIFEPFFTTKPPGEGTGLGLSVVKDIVEDHGGFVEVLAGAGGGSVFTMYLPRSAPDVG
ncbi:MAG: HAMP domain-containing sensor histidine kinase [Myxococcales bacterium]